MDKEYILDELRRTAAENDGKSLGRQRFESETGIKPHHLMKYWARYGDALKEAGLVSNTLQEAYDDESVVRRVAALARELGRLPTWGDFRVKRTNDKTFPSHGVFERFPKAELVRMVLAFCEANPDFGDVEQFFRAAVLPKADPKAATETKPDTANDGFVYLLKSGKPYKSGKTNHVGRRERELAIQLPQQANAVHSIRTDDPDGIEAYWHRRFAEKRPQH